MIQAKKGWNSLMQGEKETYLSRTEANRMLGEYLQRRKKERTNHK